MTILKVQEFLQKGGTPEQLTAELGIIVNTNPKFSGLHLFNYHQLDSPKTDSIVMECRGLILDKSKDWEIVHFPMIRFFNYGEALNVALDIDDGVYLEKLDGSLIGLAYHNDEWIKSTRGVINGEGSLTFSAKTFNDLLKETWNKNNYKFPETHYDLTFELTTPENRHVTRYTDYKLSILCARRKDNHYIECDQDEKAYIAKQCGFNLPKTYNLSKIEDAQEFVCQLDTRDEGSVFVSNTRHNSRDFYRVKVINPGHRALMRIKDSVGASMNSVMTLIMMGNVEEFTDEFPEYNDIIFDARDKYITLVNDETELFEKNKHLDRKEFAIATKESKSKYMFMMYEHDISFKECIKMEAKKKSMKTVAKKFTRILGVDK
jgi:hypothetical protein